MSKRREAASADLPWGSENINQHVQQHWYQLPWPNKKTYDLGCWALGVPLLILVALAESQRRWGANGACYVEVERTVFTHSFTYLFVHSLCGGDSEVSMNSVLPFYNNRIVVGHMAANLPYIYQLLFPCGMWEVMCATRHLDMCLQAFSPLPTSWNPSTQPWHAEENSTYGLWMTVGGAEPPTDMKCSPMIFRWTINYLLKIFKLLLNLFVLAI